MVTHFIDPLVKVETSYHNKQIKVLKSEDTITLMGS